MRIREDFAAMHFLAQPAQDHVVVHQYVAAVDVVF